MSAPLLDAAGAAMDAATGRLLAETLIRGVPDTVDAGGHEWGARRRRALMLPILLSTRNDLARSGGC
jgi:hypothetical protein